MSAVRMCLFLRKWSKMNKTGKESSKLVANNKKAYHDYFIEDTLEAGIELAGTEVKSLRMGKCSIKESFIRIDHGECVIYGMHISPYEKGNIFNKDPLRPRRLLLHKSQIARYAGAIKQKGYTIMPLKVYFSGSLAKVEIGLPEARSSTTRGWTSRRRTSCVRRRKISKCAISAEFPA